MKRYQNGGMKPTSSSSSKTGITFAFLPAAPLLNSLPVMPQPDWSLLKGAFWISVPRSINKLSENYSYSHDIMWALEVIDERENALLVVQYIHLSKLNQCRQTKEEKKNRTKHFPKGYGSSPFCSK
jgi:hypothetical protein